MVVCSRPQLGHGDTRDMNDAPHDLHDSVTLATFVSQLEKDNLQQSSGYGRGICGFHHVEGTKKHIMWVSVCVCVHVSLCVCVRV